MEENRVTKKATTKKKDAGLTWLPHQGQHRDQWLAEGYDGAAPRIKQLDNHTFACYRDGLYLGSEKTIDAAKDRCVEGKVSEKNRVMGLWEKEHPNELPPGLQLTDAERAEYWRRHPPKAQPARTVGRNAAPRPEEDPATAKLRAELAADGARGPTGRAKVAAKPGGRTRGASEPPAGGIIRVVNGANPKRAGTGAHGRWATLFSFDGKTVGEYARAKGHNMTTLANAVAKKHVRVEEK